MKIDYFQICRFRSLLLHKEGEKSSTTVRFNNSLSRVQKRPHLVNHVIYSQNPTYTRSLSRLEKNHVVRVKNRPT